MEPQALFGPEHFIWRTLPIHPQPQPLESFSSYVTRLAQANGLQSMSELAALAGSKERYRFDQRHLDYPLRLHLGLAEIAGCSLASLQCTTFFHLGQHFGFPGEGRFLHRFLRNSLAKSLRYCPHCLAQQAHPYHSLVWRLSLLEGCLEHRCLLLNRCGHCGSSLPLFVLFPQLARCSNCQGDLRTCQTDQLPKEVAETTRRRTEDLKMLLTPVQWTAEAAQARVIGKHFAFLRQQCKLSIHEVASRMQAQERVILDIEHANWRTEAILNHALFHHYVQYADVLDSSLRDIFDEKVLQSLLTSLSEGQVLEQVKAAIQQLRAQGEPLTQGNVARIIGIPASHLKQHPHVRLFLKGEREDELIRRVEHTVKQLEDRREAFSLRRVCTLAGLSYSWATQCPRVRALVRQSEATVWTRAFSSSH